jgi:hypothetical protein
MDDLIKRGERPLLIEVQEEETVRDLSVRLKASSRTPRDLRALAGMERVSPKEKSVQLKALDREIEASAGELEDLLRLQEEAMLSEALHEVLAEADLRSEAFATGHEHLVDEMKADARHRFVEAQNAFLEAQHKDTEGARIKLGLLFKARDSLTESTAETP